MKSFVKDKKPETNLFDQINAQRLNDYLHTLMEGLTAKVIFLFKKIRFLELTMLLTLCNKNWIKVIRN